MHPIDQIKRFAHLTPDDEERLRAAMLERVFARGERLTGASQLSSTAFFILEGAVRVFFLKGGKDHTVSFSFADEFVYLSHFGLAHEPDTITLEFLETTRVVYIPHQPVKEILNNTPIIKNEALLFGNIALVTMLERLEERMFMAQTCKAPELYRWAVTRIPRLTEVANITQIASYLGLTRETLYRIQSGKYNK